MLGYGRFRVVSARRAPLVPTGEPGEELGNDCARIPVRIPVENLRERREYNCNRRWILLDLIELLHHNHLSPLSVAGVREQHHQAVVG